MTGYQSKRAAARDKLAEQQEPVAKYCCHVCFDKSGQTFLDRMILCSECGNKRCPKATNHALPCTNSNNPNQAGSVFTTPPQRKPLTIEYQSGYYDGKQAALDGREWNFCERCGKRTADLTVIHTCTPPQENT